MKNLDRRTSFQHDLFIEYLSDKRNRLCIRIINQTRDSGGLF
ncbi:MAG TPA: hypothetical protein PLV22_02785 [Candidatus Cloacimonadota bacterium]|nr:hypothetical protein [Candidatus Cloacimonadota bacterium]